MDSRIENDSPSRCVESNGFDDSIRTLCRGPVPKAFQRGVSRDGFKPGLIIAEGCSDFVGSVATENRWTSAFGDPNNMKASSGSLMLANPQGLFPQ